MSKKINEAQVKIDIMNLNSSDLSTLARMMELAGQAEQGAVPSTSSSIGVPGSIAGAVDSMGNTEPSEVEVGYDVDSEPDVSSSLEVGSEPDVDPLQSSIEELGGMTDFGAQDDELTDIDVVESEEIEDEDAMIEEELKRMTHLSGIVTEDEDVEVDSDDDDDKDESDDDVDLDESRIIPDLSLEEDTSDVTEYGPFDSEQDAIRDAKWKTNGELGDNFNVDQKEDGHFYWSRVMQEQAFSTEADPELVDTDGIQYSRHRMKPKFNGAALGDNPLREEEQEDEETVDDIFESLQKRYTAFVGGKK